MKRASRFSYLFVALTLCALLGSATVANAGSRHLKRQRIAKGASVTRLGASKLAERFAGDATPAGATTLALGLAAPLAPLADGVWIFNTNATAAPWSTTANWSGGTIADAGGLADFSTINITGARNPDIDTTSRTVRRIDIGDTNNTHSYTISASGGASLIFDNTANSANAQLNETATSHGDTISAPIILTSSLDITNPTVNTLTLSGAISGSGALNLASGTLALGTSVSTYSGGTTLSGGSKITIGASGTPLGSGTLTLSGGTLQITASHSTAMANNVVLTADSALSTTSTANPSILNFSGTLSGTAGTLTLRSDATAGQLDVRFSGGDFTMSRPIVIDNGVTGGTARLTDFNATGTTHTYDGVISGNGSYNRSVSSGTGGTTIFTASNTYTGTTTVNSGILQLGSGGTTGSLSASSAITVNTAGTFAINRSNAVVQGTDFSGAAIAGAGKFLQAGSGTTTLNIANTYSGGTTISGGTLIASADGALGTGNVSLTGGTVTLTLQSGATNNYIADTASISIVSGAVTNLNYALGQTDIVNGITLGGVVQTAQGTYGSSTSGATFQSAFFTGNGTLTLVPEPSTWMMIGVGAVLLAGVQRFRRK